MLLGLDLGTGSAKALLIDSSGTIRGEGAASYTVRSPRPGWVESNPQDWWNACANAVRTAVGTCSTSVMALGLSGQMHGVVLSDVTGSALRPAVLWADVRSADQLAYYRDLDARLFRTLVNPPAAGMAGPSLLWLRDNEPEVYRAARWALQPKDWLRLRLTHEALAEPSDASATLIYDLEADGWSSAVLGALNLREHLFPPLVASSAIAGTLTREAARSLGLPADLPVTAGAGDTAAALLGSGILEPGPVQLTVGTGGQIISPRENLIPDPHLRTHLYRAAHDHDPGRFYAMAAVQNVGLALEWVIKTLGVSWEEAYREVFSTPPDAGGVTFLPYLTGERTPHFDSSARGTWVGLGLDHRRSHLLRSAFEGVAFALREGLETLEEIGVHATELRLAGGGTLHESWRRLLADVLGQPLRPVSEFIARSASARGAALLAGISIGVYRTVADTLALTPELGEAILPSEPASYNVAYARYKELYPRLYER